MFDLVINNGMLIDPERMIRYRGSVGIIGNKIVEIAAKSLDGVQKIDASGLTVCPGFIDAHGHVDSHRYTAELSLRQGVTTTVGGNCGLSPIDLKYFFSKQRAGGFPLNQAEFVGHSVTLRGAVGVKSPYIPANSEQVRRMAHLAEEALEEGACGISFGLDYAPGSSEEEILALAQIAAKYGRLISIHTRMFTKTDVYSLQEAVSISRKTGVRVLVSHFVYQYGSGVMDEALEIVEDARAAGLDVWIDSGMYTPWATSISSTIFDEENLEKCHWGYENLLISSGKYTGNYLTPQIYSTLRRQRTNDCVICFTGDQNSIYSALEKDYAMPSSDTGPYQPGEGHPQIAGTFPRYFREMVRKEKAISLEEAVRKATLLPAQTIGLKYKGRLRIGFDADLTVFDPELITDKSDFADRGKPDAYPDGIQCVIVNGHIAVFKGHILAGREGRMIRFEQNNSTKRKTADEMGFHKDRHILSA